jgi:hypothetical protein
MIQKEYDRAAVLRYAENWALSRNSAYYDYSALGGDCTNFASQCVFAGCGVMNPTPVHGWYYKGSNNKSPSWTGVSFLYQFLLNNTGAGPYAAETDITRVERGDIIQLAHNGKFHHSLVVTDAGAAADSIRVSAHTYDALRKPLMLYSYDQFRCLHILGARGY